MLVCFGRCCVVWWFVAISLVLVWVMIVAGFRLIWCLRFLVGLIVFGVVVVF